MRTATAFVAATVLLAFVAQCHAGRATDMPFVGETIRRASESMKTIRAHFGLGAEEDSKYLDRPSHVSIKYFVLPSKHQSFIDAWKKLQGSLQDTQGLKKFDIHKTMSDNMLFFEYQEWETVRQSMGYHESKEFQEFADFVDNEGIEWELKLLRKMCDEGVCDQEPEQEDIKGTKTHMLSFFHVPPGQGDEFVQQWTQAAKQTQQEKGNHIYSLHKVALDNLHFIGYGMWETWQDLIDHSKSEHFLKFKDHITKTDIIWMGSLAKMVTEQEQA